MPVTFQTLQTDLAPDLWRSWINGALEANRAGAWLVPQVAGKPASVLVGFESSYHPFVDHVAYRAIADLPLEERLARLRTPEVRAAILAEEPPTTMGPAAFLLANFHKLFPLEDPPDYELAPETSVGANAEREGRPPFEVAYDLMLQREGQELLYLPILGYANGGLWAIDEMLRHPGTVLGLGDGGAHCGVLCDASLPTFMLTHWARDRKQGGTFEVEEIVAHQTSRTAALYAFTDRGVVRPGYLADLNVIDFEGLTLAPPEMAYDLPAGGKRLIQTATGAATVVGLVVRSTTRPRASGRGASSVRDRLVATNGIELQVTEAGDDAAALVVLCHGFPELGSRGATRCPPSWRPATGSRSPTSGATAAASAEAIDEYDIVHLNDDLLGLLDDVGRERAVFVGHDWGSMVV